MRLVNVNSTFAYGMSSAHKNDCCPKPKHAHRHQSYRGVVIVENPKTQEALRNACRIIAADIYERGKKA